jgi:hypothetical protein
VVLEQRVVDQNEEEIRRENSVEGEEEEEEEVNLNDGVDEIERCKDAVVQVVLTFS